MGDVQRRAVEPTVLVVAERRIVAVLRTTPVVVLTEREMGNTYSTGEDKIISINLVYAVTEIKTHYLF